MFHQSDNREYWSFSNEVTAVILVYKTIKYNLVPRVFSLSNMTAAPYWKARRPGGRGYAAMLVYQKGPVDMWIELFLNGKSSFLFREICIANDKVCEDDL